MTERERTYAWQDPVQLAAEAGELGGLEFLRAMRDGDVPHPPICATIGFRLVEVDEGSSTFELEPGEHQYNPIGTIHGSVIVAALDSATGCAVHSTVPPGGGYATVDLTTSFLRPAFADSGTLRCEASLINRGRRTALAEGRLFDRDRRLLAHATATCLILGA